MAITVAARLTDTAYDCMNEQLEQAQAGRKNAAHDQLESIDLQLEAAVLL